MNPTNGNYVVAWSSNNQIPGAGWDVYARLYNAAGTPQGSPFLVNTTTTNDQQAPAVAMDSNGDFVITWMGHQSGSWDIYAQRYNAAGVAQGGETLVNTTTTNDQTEPTVAMDSAGDYVIAWSGHQSGNWQIYAQRYSAAGVAQGGEFLVNAPVGSDQTTPTVGMDNAGDFTIAWAGHQSGSWDVYAHRYNALGIAQGGLLQVNTTTANDQETPSLAMDANGDFVVTWASNNQDGSGWGVFAQRYSSTGMAQGGEFQVNTYTQGDQENPMAAMAPGGTFVITWSSQNQDGSGWGVYAQAFNASGVPYGNETQVNTFTAGDQEYSAVAVTQEAVIVWSSHDQDGNGWGVYGQQFRVSGITVTPTTQLTTTKAGGTATFSVVLNSQPTSAVQINLSSSSTQEGTLSTNTLVFNPVNWNVAQQVTITGHNDGMIGNTSYAINFAAAQSSDPSYNSLVVPSLSVVNDWIALAGITVTPLTPQVTTEAGGTAQFSVMLDSAPLFNVVIPTSSSDTTAGTVSASSLTFTSADWNVAQVVTVTGVDDQIATPDRTYYVNIGAAQSLDPLYDLLAASTSSLTYTNQEIDTAGVTVTPLTPLTTTESGGTAQFSVVLTSQPTGNVVIPISSSDTTAGTVSASSLAFTSADWNVAHLVTVTGASDYIVTPSRTYTVNIGAAQSTDSFYNGQLASSLTLTDQETDSSGVLVTLLTPQTTTESGGTAQFSVALTSAPAAPVVIPIASSDPTAGTVDKPQLTFDASDWNVAQVVTVTGVDDQVVTPNRTYTVNIGAAQSTDYYYSNKFASSLTLTNQETDTAGVTVLASNPLVTTESGGSDQFSVVLASKPTANVVIPISSSDPTAGTLSTAALTFTPLDWNQPQTVTVTGADDQVFTADRTYTIAFSPASSADPTYNGWQLASLRALNQETDTPAPPTPTVPQPVSLPTDPQSSLTGGPSVSPAPTVSPPTAGIPAVGTPSLPAASAGATTTIQQVILQQRTTTPVGAGSSRGPAVPVVLAAGSQSTNSGAMTLTSLVSAGQALSSAASGGGGGAALHTHSEADPPKAQVSTTVPETTPAQGLTRDAVAPPVSPLVITPPLAPPTTGLLPPAKGPVVPPTVKLDYLRAQLEEGPAAVEPASRLEKAAQVIFTSGMVTSVGYVIFSSRGGSWLLSALTARPLWKQFDPLEVLFAWEAEKKRLGLDGEDETLQSLVE
jgi:hypothetical protein